MYNYGIPNRRYHTMGFDLKKEVFVNKTFRLPKELVEKCQQTASAKGVFLNYFVQKAMSYALENMDDDNMSE